MGKIALPSLAGHDYAPMGSPRRYPPRQLKRGRSRGRLERIGWGRIDLALDHLNEPIVAAALAQRLLEERLAGVYSQALSYLAGELTIEAALAQELLGHIDAADQLSLHRLAQPLGRDGQALFVCGRRAGSWSWTRLRRGEWRNRPDQRCPLCAAHEIAEMADEPSPIGAVDNRLWSDLRRQLAQQLATASTIDQLYRDAYRLIDQRLAAALAAQTDDCDPDALVCLLHYMISHPSSTWPDLIATSLSPLALRLKEKKTS